MSSSMNIHTYVIHKLPVFVFLGDCDVFWCLKWLFRTRRDVMLVDLIGFDLI